MLLAHKESQAPEQFDPDNHRTNSQFWRFDTAPQRRSRLKRVLRGLKRIAGERLNIEISSKASQRNIAFVSFPTDRRIIAIRNRALVATLHEFLAALGIARDPDFVRGCIEDFDRIFQDWPHKDLRDGLGYNNGLVLYLFTRAVDPQTVVESGVWRGFTTYLLDAATKASSRLFCFDINLSKLVWKSGKARYFENDVSQVPFERTGRVMAFFDDHVSQYERLIFADAGGFDYLAFDDDVTYLNVHSDGWPPIPTVSMVWNRDGFPAEFEWVSEDRKGSANISTASAEKLKARYAYVTAPELFELTGYRNSSRTSFLVRRQS